jgi:large subunit ribosomal protein L29
MKKDKLAGIDPSEMEVKLKEIEEQTFRIRFQMSMGQTDGLRKLREMRKDKARLMTYLRARELRASESPASKSKGAK